MPSSSRSLDQFYYLNYKNFPSTNISQCFSFMNQLGGGRCTVNSCLFGEYGEPRRAQSPIPKGMSPSCASREGSQCYHPPVNGGLQSYFGIT